jgi:ssDNA-binding Zn-finger/Zn-ribbon topoisomerase 1
MTIWTQKLDMATIPDDVLAREWSRRAVAKRDSSLAGRNKILKPCPSCGVIMGARELRAHRYACSAEHKPVSYKLKAPCPRCRSSTNIVPWGSMARCTACRLNF